MIIDFTDKSLYVDWVSEVTKPLYDHDVRYIFLQWGSGAGKSYTVAQLLVQNIMDWIRTWVFRKVSNTLKGSCRQLFKDVVSSWWLEKYVDIKENNDVKWWKWFAMMFWLDDPEKIKSLANFNWFRLEEATELTYDDFTQLDLRLRWNKNHKIICTFNPISSKHRLKKEIRDHPERRKNAVWILKTAWDNKFVDQHYLKSLDDLRERNEAKRRIYAKNLRGEGLKWSIYPDYNIFDHNIDPDIIWLDFGFNDPNALVYLKEVDVWSKKDLYVQEKIYLSWLTGTELINEMNRIWVPKHILIIADSARPELIEEIRRAWYLIIWVKKYAKSKNDQIGLVQSYNLHINWANLLKEVSWYVRKLNKNWEPMDIPEDGDDHLCDATWYGVTWFKRNKVTALFV